VGGRTLAYHRAGSGPPLVLLHGGWSDGREWRFQLRRCPRISTLPPGTPPGVADRRRTARCHPGFRDGPIARGRTPDQPRGARGVQRRGPALPAKGAVTRRGWTVSSTRPTGPGPRCRRGRKSAPPSSPAQGAKAALDRRRDSALREDQATGRSASQWLPPLRPARSLAGAVLGTVPGAGCCGSLVQPSWLGREDDCVDRDAAPVAGGDVMDVTAVAYRWGGRCGGAADRVPAATAKVATSVLMISSLLRDVVPACRVPLPCAPDRRAVTLPVR
jgi:hypothetical protein